MEDFSAKRQALLDSGVKMMDPDTVYVEESVTVGPGTRAAARAPSCGGRPSSAGTARSAPTP